MSDRRKRASRNPTESKNILIKRGRPYRVESTPTRQSKLPIREAVARGLGDLPSQFMQETISERIRFLGARVWIFLPLYLGTFKISRTALV
jgi:hypothetical protein